MTIFKEKSQSNFNAALFALSLERLGEKPLHLQLTDLLRQMILGGGDLSGTRLPSSRMLAEELSVSRMTVTTAYDQLLGEGYLNTRQGGGTYVATQLPHLSPVTPRKVPKARPPKAWLPFQPGLPDPKLFPHRLWARHLERAWQSPEPGLLASPDPMGWYPLRAAIGEHLSAWRGLECLPDQIIITSGAWDAFDILARAVLTVGDAVAVEDPGWPTLRGAFEQAGLIAMPAPIDSKGLPARLIPRKARAAIVTPSRHFPTGHSMPLARRLAMLDWARQTKGLVIEDDYDSEFRYQGQPLPSLAGLDGLQNTIYLGSFSKLLSPVLRIGYLVLPLALVEQARNYLEKVGSRASLVPQPALAAFMNSGEFATHLRRCRRSYAKRQDVLVKALTDASHLLTVNPDSSGMHLCCPLTPEMQSRASDVDLSRRGAENGLTLRPLSNYSSLPNPQQGLLLGYAAFDESTLSEAARVLLTVLSDT